MAFEFCAEVFNLFNHAEWSAAPDRSAALPSATWLRLTSLTVLELGVKFIL